MEEFPYPTMMLKGQDPGTIAENIKLLRRIGLSEEEATARAIQFSVGFDPKKMTQSSNNPKDIRLPNESGRTDPLLLEDLARLTYPPTPANWSSRDIVLPKDKRK